MHTKCALFGYDGRMYMRLPPSIRRFIRYASVGVTTLVFDLILLAIVIETFDVSYYAAVPICFVLAVSINYVISRLHVFKGTSRSLHAGYAYFVANAAVGALITTSGVAFLVSFFAFHYLVARVLVAGVVGILSYLVNLHLNFKVVGIHHTPSATIDQ